MDKDWGQGLGRKIENNKKDSHFRDCPFLIPQLSFKLSKVQKKGGIMTNDIIKLLDLKDSNIKVTDIKIKEKEFTREIYLEHENTHPYCPTCSCKMYSKGFYVRRINHPIYQDGLSTVLVLKVRRWLCINPDCKTILTDQFPFVSKYRRNTDFADILIVEAFRDINASARQIAKRFNVSHTHAINTFMRYVDMPRRNLTEAISIDEVYLGISDEYKYALIIQDFKTGEPLDMVVSRREIATQPYFASIPMGERAKVKYLITDMYRPYAAYIDKYFHNAIHVVDAFHVISLINRKYLQYILKLQRRIKEADDRRHEALEQTLRRKVEYSYSKEYYLLKTKRWILLMSDYHKTSWGWRYDKILKREMACNDYEYELYKIDPNLKRIHDLKEEYIRFNNRYAGRPKESVEHLKEIIKAYSDSDLKIFNEIAETLSEFFNAIVASFTLVEKLDKANKINYYARLSNGPIESINRAAKDLKRVGRGYHNFQYARNRFLFSQRKNAQILGNPKTLKQVIAEKGIKKGPKNHKIINFTQEIEQEVD